MTIREALQNLLAELRRSAEANQRRYIHGSDVTSMAEDNVAEAIAQEQERIIGQIELILHLES